MIDAVNQPPRPSRGYTRDDLAWRPIAECWRAGSSIKTAPIDVDVWKPSAPWRASRPPSGGTGTS
jgi:hypothetical protein